MELSILLHLRFPSRVSHRVPQGERISGRLRTHSRFSGLVNSLLPVTVTAHRCREGSVGVFIASRASLRLARILLGMMRIDDHYSVPVHLDLTTAACMVIYNDGSTDAGGPQQPSRPGFIN